MNRLAVVLAADSATTVTQWTEHGPEPRYFKGANKIFQLSDHQPVGLMIFDAADILRVPWEIVVKSFRSDLGSKSFNHLPDYASEFFAFLQSNVRLFPSTIQKEFLVDAARSAALKITMRRDFEERDEDRIAENNRRAAERRTWVDQQPNHPALPPEAIEEIVAATVDDAIAAIEAWREAFGQAFPDDIAAFARGAIIDVLKSPAAHLSTTGLVFAGFGDHDVFPRFVEYKSCGVLASRHIAIDGEHVEITHDTPAWLASFAQTAMSDTFSLGLNEEVYRSVMVTVDEGIRNLLAEVIPASGGNPEAIPDLAQRIDNARQSVARAILDHSKNEHAIPLRRVLGVLPVNEMAELAETLINLQSLKEKVTKNSETVGGPVDVAVITKSEGLVWIKRKHYFDPNLNSRYLARQQARYQGR